MIMNFKDLQQKLHNIEAKIYSPRIIKLKNLKNLKKSIIALIAEVLVTGQMNVQANQKVLNV